MAPGRQRTPTPGQRGFDEAIVSAGQHFDFKTSPQTPYPAGTYLADFLTEKAVDFIRRARKRRSISRCTTSASTRRTRPAALIERFKPKSPVEWHNDPVYAAMLASVDESVGRVLATLDELQAADNTLVIFTSDNRVGGYVREDLKAKDTTDNAPLRGGKMLYEEGIRVPTSSAGREDCPRKHMQRADQQRRPLPDAAPGRLWANSPENTPLDGEACSLLLGGGKGA